MDASLIFDIDSVQARTAATDLIKLGDAAVKASRGFTRIDGPLRAANGQFRSAVSVIEDYGNEVSDLSKEFNTFASATLKAQQYEIRLNRAIELGVASKAEAAAELREYQRALRAANPLVRELEKAERDAAQADKIASERREAARREFIPLYAASKQYEAALNRLNDAERAGDISATQHAAALSELNASYQRSAAAAQRFGQSQELARHHVANLSFQLNDIGMMMALGQNPFMLMMQQGPQVAQIIGQMNQEGRKLGPTLAGAFSMFLNPTTAVTLALVGGTAALFQWGRAALGAEKDTLSLADATSALNSRVSAIKGYAEISKKSILELSKEYGGLAFRIRDSATALVEYERAQLRADIIKSVSAARKEYGALGVDLDAVRSKLEALPDAMRYGRGSSGIAAEMLRAEQAVNNLARQMDISVPSAESLSAALYRLDNAVSFDDQAAALANVRNIMRELNIDAAMLPDEIRQALIGWERLNLTISQSEGEVRAAVGATNDWVGSMSSVLSYVNAISQSLANIGGDGIRFAAIRAETKALQEGRSLRDASLAAARETARLEGEARTAELTKQHGIFGKILGMGEAAARQVLITEEASLDILREQAREREREANKKPDKSAERKAAAELRAAEKGFQSLRELMEKESLFQFAEYDKRQKQLDTALNKRLLSEDAYEKMSAELRTMYFGSAYEIQALNYQLDQEALQSALDQKLITEEEYYRKRKEMYWANLLNEDNRSDMAQDLSNTAQYFGQLAALTGNGYDTLNRLQKSFAASAALVNAYLAASQTLADPTLGFWAKMAAYGKVLAAGLGLVSAIKGGGGRGSSSASASTQQAAKEPTRFVTINWDGPDWMRDGMNGLLDEIYKQSKDGRVIIAQERR